MIDYNPIEDLHNRLDEAEIPHVFVCEIWPGFGIFGDRKPKDQFVRNQVCYPVDSKDDVNHECLFDAVWQYGSYGDDYELETWHELGADETGEPRTMTVEEAFNTIANDYKLSEANKEEKKDE